MSVDTALHFTEQFFDVQKSYRVCFLMAVLAWFLQVLALSTYGWMTTNSSSMGLWTYCNYTIEDFKCCQTLNNFLGKQYKIPSIPTWLSAALVFEIFGLVTSMIFVISCVVMINAIDFKLKKIAKGFNYVFSLATVIFVLIGALIFTGEYNSESWTSGARLSTSFGTCITSGIFHLICFLLLFVSNDNAVHSLDNDQRWEGPVSAIGTNEFWEEILDHSTTPMNWTEFEGGYKVTKYLSLKNLCKTVKVGQKEFNAVRDLVMGTWDSNLVGAGADGANIFSLNKLVWVTDVERIENVDLWDNYVHARAKLIRSYLKNGAFNKLENTSSSTRGPILTARFMDSPLTDGIYPQLNEYYLFHGTKSVFVDNIMRKGMDPRHSADRTMMGRGNYCAESSTKSDQYADDKHQRQNTGLKMFLVRMLLGNIYVARNAHQYKLPPCTTCLTDSCKNKNHEHHDSVVADIPNKNFREFIVYDAHQCYPEYIITYNRC